MQLSQLSSMRKLPFPCRGDGAGAGARSALIFILMLAGFTLPLAGCTGLIPGLPG